MSAEADAFQNTSSIVNSGRLVGLEKLNATRTHGQSERGWRKRKQEEAGGEMVSRTLQTGNVESRQKSCGTLHGQ